MNRYKSTRRVVAKKKVTNRRGPIKWKGEHVFYIAGTDHDDDTIRIPAAHRKDEEFYKLILPTLCITFADMKFANEIGCKQADYPDSIPYGEKYFDPAVVLNNKKEIEKITWIRGAERVTIGPKRTVIEFRSWEDLIIPKLRIKKREKIEAFLNFENIRISVNQPFVATVKQYADGRHVGGINVTKRHPAWEPKEEPENYDLLIRVIEGKTRRALGKVAVRLSTWDDKKQEFVTEAIFYTDGMGIVNVTDLPCSDKKLITVEQKPWLTKTWRFRPFPGQKIKKFFRLWRNDASAFEYKWKLKDTIKSVAGLAGVSRTQVLRMNKLRNEKELKAARIINVPYTEAVYHVEPRDTLKSIAKYFCYKSAKELAKLNDLSLSDKLYPDHGIKLPGWRFFFAQRNDQFIEIDKKFGIPKSWTRSVQRVLHDNPKKTYENEVIAVPTLEFVKKHKL